MVLGDAGTRITNIRGLAGGVSERTFPDDDIEVKMEENDNWVEVKTNKFDWDDTDNQFKQVIKASNMMTAADLEDEVNTPESKKSASDHRLAARDIVKAINRKDHETQSNTILVSKGVNVTDKLDPENYTQIPTDDGTGIN